MNDEPSNSSLATLDVFSGIGGFSLGLERTGGFRTMAFCEIDPFCRQVLAKHWPDVPQYDDIRSLTADRLRADGIAVDVICGGFPCQGVSSEGRKRGLADERSGLWSEYARLVGEIRPSVVIVENVRDLLARGFATVLGDLAALGYDAWWDCIPACAVGAPQKGDRLWVLAAPGSQGHEPEPHGLYRISLEKAALWIRHSLAGRRSQDGGWRGDWPTEPKMGRVVDGLPRMVVQPHLHALGNAVVPQIPELIGRAILFAFESKCALGKNES